MAKTGTAFLLGILNVIAVLVIFSYIPIIINSMITTAIKYILIFLVGFGLARA